MAGEWGVIRRIVQLTKLHSPFPPALTQSILGLQLCPCEVISNSILKLSYHFLSTYCRASALPTINNAPTLSLILTLTQERGCVIIPLCRW